MSIQKDDSTTNEFQKFNFPMGASPFVEQMLLGELYMAKGKGRLELLVEDKHLRPLGIMHGGVLCSVLDSVMGMAAGSTAPPDHHVVTMQLNVNFIRPVWKGETIIATSEIQHIGRQTAVGRGEVHTKEGILAGTASGTFMYLPHTDETRKLMPKLPEAEIQQMRGS